MKKTALNFILQNQNADGGWGYFPNKKSSTEPTAFCLMALANAPDSEKSRERGVAYLSDRQLPSGGWKISDVDGEPACWVSALAAAALVETKGYDSNLERAARYVVGCFQRSPVAFISRFFSFLTGKTLDEPGGWCWTPATYPWVEPTCYALLFLKKIRQRWHSDPSAAIILEAERMLYKRMCKNGGWNYGNARILGEELLPYSLTTAIALIALQDQHLRQENQLSVKFLKASLAQEKSWLNLAMGQIALDIYGEHQAQSPLESDSLSPEDFMNNLKTAAIIEMASKDQSARSSFKF